MDLNAQRDTWNYPKMLISVMLGLYNFKGFSLSYLQFYILLHFLPMLLLETNFYFTFQRENTNLKVTCKRIEFWKQVFYYIPEQRNYVMSLQLAFYTLLESNGTAQIPLVLYFIRVLFCFVLSLWLIVSPSAEIQKQEEFPLVHHRIFNSKQQDRVKRKSHG